MRKESGASVVLAYNRHIEAGHDRRSRLKGVALVRRDDTFDCGVSETFLEGMSWGRF